MVMMMKWDAGSGYIGSGKKPKRGSFEKLVFSEYNLFFSFSVEKTRSQNVPRDHHIRDHKNYRFDTIGICLKTTLPRNGLKGILSSLASSDLESWSYLP